MSRPATAADTARAALRRVRDALTPDRLLAALCLVVALGMAAPWARVPVAELIGREVSYSVPDLLAVGQLTVERTQSLEDLLEQARGIAERAAGIVDRAQDAAERAQDAVERVSTALDERG